MEELKMAQFDNNYSESKEKTSEILSTVNVSYCVPDKLPGKRGMRDRSGCTSLHFAVEAMDLDLTNVLLEKGADLVKQDTNNKYTPLHIVMNKSFNTSLEHELSSEEYENLKKKECNLIYTLLTKQVDINNILNPKNKFGMSHLHIACIVNHILAVQFFAEAKEPLEQTISYDPELDPDDNIKMKHLQGCTPLHCAVKYSSVEAADILLQYGADIHVKEANGMSCVHLLINRLMDFSIVEERESIESIVKLVLETRASDEVFVDDAGLSALHLACTLGDKSIIKRLLKRKVDVNMRVKNESTRWRGWTPLHFAACFHIDTMILLMESGADITIENSDGDTPLDLCAKQFTPAEVVLVLSTKKEFKEIVLSDNCTKLLDLLIDMNDYGKFRKFLRKLKDVNLIVPFSSPIWAGYNLVHLSVLLNKELCCDRIELCLKYDCSVSMQNARGQTPIHLAFGMLKEETVKELLKRSKDNVVDENNLSYLHIACTVGDLEAVKRYLSKGANINSQVKNSFDAYGNSTPLHLAVKNDHRKLVEFLLENNADVYAKDSLGLTPVHWSISRNGYWEKYDLAKLFFEMIPDLRDSVSKDGLSHLHLAVKIDDQRAAEWMLLEGADVDSVVDMNVKKPSFLADFAGKTPLQMAVKKKSDNVIEVLLKHGANIHAKDPKGVSALQYAIDDLDSTWTTPFVQMLKDGECDVDGSGITLLHFACGDYDLEWAEKLLKNGADVNARISAKGELHGATPLYVLFVPSSIYQVDPQTIVSFVKLLLDYGADVTIDDGERTPVHMAYVEMTYYDDFYLDKTYDWQSFLSEIADLMLESQKSYYVNPISYRGFSHFHMACVMNNVEIVKKFLNHGVDVNQQFDPFATDTGGFTPLHFAMAYGSREVAYLLLERGANINAEDSYGHKPLQVAIKRKIVDLPLIQTMLRYGANIHDKNLIGESSFDSLLKYGGLTLEGLEFFFSHGCFINILESHQGIFGSAMLSAAPNEFLPILKRLVQVFEVNSAIQAGYNVIQSIVAVKYDGDLTLDNYLSSIEFLMSIGCELDQQDTEGQTALHKATSFCNIKAVCALLQLGSDLNVADNVNEYPFSYKRIMAGYNEYYDDCNKDLAQVFAIHIWKMEFIGLDLNYSNLEYLEQVKKKFPFDSYSLEQSCQDEFTKAEKTEIIPNLAVRDFLWKFGAIRRYTRLGPELRAIVDKFFECAADLRREFPELSELLALQYRKACVRRELLQPAGEAITSICQIILPDICLETILEFFTNNEMKIVIASAKELFD